LTRNDPASGGEVRSGEPVPLGNRPVGLLDGGLMLVGLLPALVEQHAANGTRECLAGDDQSVTGDQVLTVGQDHSAAAPGVTDHDT
jgi:hypothetical protein